jgi:hypothetical protein
VPVESPQTLLDKRLKQRGYNVNRYTTINSGYSNLPTPLQFASYDVHILKMVIFRKDEEAMREMLSCGISPNACNKYGESLLHKVCKSGLDDLLQVFLDCGADIQVCDGAGRTPLHNACWGPRPSFRTFELVVERDPRLIHMLDGSGASPLSYVRTEHFAAWNEFLESILDKYWPPRDTAQGPPELALVKGNSRPVPDPVKALSLELAAFVSAGRLEPKEAIAAQMGDEDDYDSDDDGSSYDSDEESSCSFFGEDGGELDEFSLDSEEADEMKEILKLNKMSMSKFVSMAA